MALRCATTPTLITPSAAVNESQSLRFASNPTAAVAVRNRRSPFFGVNSNLRLNPKPAAAAATFRCCASSLTPQLRSTLDKVVESSKVVLFMKGTKDFPMCGFSNTVVQILKTLNVPFEDVNILENELLRQGLKEYSNWPTFPQLYIDGEFFGGCDITIEAFQSGELQEVLEKGMCS